MLTSTRQPWTIVYFSERVRQQIFELPQGILGEYLRMLELLQNHGADLRMPFSKAMGNKLFELRPCGRDGTGRVFYCALKGRRIVMLHSFVKKTEKTPAQELRIARKRLKDVQNG
ncbi:type II toxin-antitoxin system RelE/ParE family toxin [Caballeronia sp. LZ065]|uniref:type II toxin-antitoxin system RelE/ParE family toxin n=1 Tax=Caballeronia sp. LZ065 TaxID=3038571 RepID=UPI00286702A4|nr:type II toxin-antitoxin system RelE/ParE family toxin [Caballeronia sp. LZ065]MDR5778269.1 type II toxin-antitoxin system RelE/ParE family toxin [Caballeronia sp. LZ065]